MRLGLLRIISSGTAEKYRVSYLPLYMLTHLNLLTWKKLAVLEPGFCHRRLGKWRMGARWLDGWMDGLRGREEQSRIPDDPRKRHNRRERGSLGIAGRTDEQRFQFPKAARLQPTVSRRSLAPSLRRRHRSTLLLPRRSFFSSSTATKATWAICRLHGR